MKIYRLITGSLLALALFFSVASVFAAELKGSVSVSRNNSRQIDGAILHVGNQEYEIVMDENGKSLAQMYEHKDIKVSCNVDGKKITVETWEEIRNASPEPAYKEPEPEPEPQEEPEEEPEEKEPTDDDEPKDEEPKDEEPKDEPSDDEEPKDEEPKEESED